MPSQKITISCPNCRTPQVIDSQQVFDAQQEPQSKQRILTGTPNILQCTNCGYQGPIHQPVVYHDAEKELLLTHVPPELGLPIQEQERIIGPLITQIVDGLPPEKRKAYLLQPKTMLTMQTMVETILEKDGVTKEMLDAQQDRIQLLQRLANLSGQEAIEEVARQEDALIDREFFSILSMLVSNALSSGDEALARRLVEVQQFILPVTTYGQEVQKQAEEMQAASDDLQALGEGLTREALLDLVIGAPNDIRLRSYVSMARPGMDYEFFRLLSERIDRARPDARSRLAKLREKLLDLTRQYDEQAAEQAEQMKKVVDALVDEDDPKSILEQNPNMVNEMFLNVLQVEFESARSAGDLKRSARLQEIVEIINAMATPPPEIELVNDLISAPDDERRREILATLSPEQLSSVLDMMVNLMPQVEASGDEDTRQAVQAAYRLVLKRSMKMNMQKAG